MNQSEDSKFGDLDDSNEYGDKICFLCHTAQPVFKEEI